MRRSRRAPGRPENRRPLGGSDSKHQESQSRKAAWSARHHHGPTEVASTAVSRAIISGSRPPAHTAPEGQATRSAFAVKSHLDLRKLHLAHFWKRLAESLVEHLCGGVSGARNIIPHQHHPDAAMLT